MAVTALALSNGAPDAGGRARRLAMHSPAISGLSHSTLRAGFLHFYRVADYRIEAEVAKGWSIASHERDLEVSCKREHTWRHGGASADAGVSTAALVPHFCSGRTTYVAV